MAQMQNRDAASMALIDGLFGSKTFEQASTLALRAILDAASRSLQSSPFATSGRIQRAMIHMRTDGAYRHLVVMELGDSGLSLPDSQGHALFSSTGWRWVGERGQAISIDVSLGRVCRDPRSGVDFVADVSPPVDWEFSPKSQARLIDRDVTHVLAVPLRTAGSVAVDGMVTVEANCRAAMGLPFIWPQCTDFVQRLADLVAPYLTALPKATTSSPDADAFLPVIGASMAPTIDLLKVFAQQLEPILIGGPTGSGKSRLARWCHEHSRVREQPFEALDLCAVPEELQMAELFGWKRGAFTGAVRDNVGFIARARGGTLFIDEITNLSPRAQAGLLHVFEERTYRVLGEGGPEKVADVRFIVGTNEDLQAAVRDKRFREDLYYRINVLPVSLPPLNQRIDEIAPWAQYMLARRHAKHGGSGRAEISRAGQLVLQREEWPGNLRQLDNIIRRAYAVAVMSRDAQSDPSLVLTEDHLNRAIAYESPVRSNESFQVLMTAAAAFVNLALDRVDGAPVDLDLVDGFKGLVLAGALERLGGDLDKVFRLFGRDKLVQGRNHHKAFRRELERAQQLHAILDSSAKFPFSAFLERQGSEPESGPNR